MTRKNEPKYLWRECEYCSRGFYPNTKWQVNCNSECRNKKKLFGINEKEHQEKLVVYRTRGAKWRKTLTSKKWLTSYYEKYYAVHGERIRLRRRLYYQVQKMKGGKTR